MSIQLAPNMITIDSIRTVSLPDLTALLDTHISSPQQPTSEFLDSLPSDDGYIYCQNSRVPVSSHVTRQGQYRDGGGMQGATVACGEK